MKRSKVARQPSEIREELERLWREGRLRIDDLMEFLRSKGVDVGSDPINGVSRSGLHRYLHNLDQVAGRMREAEQIAGSVVAKLGEGGNVRKLLTQLLSQIALYQLQTMESEGSAVKPADLMFLARAMKDIEGAFKTGADAELKIRRELAALVSKKLEAAGNTVSELAQRGGISAATANAIRAEIAKCEI